MKHSLINKEQERVQNKMKSEELVFGGGKVQVIKVCFILLGCYGIVVVNWICKGIWSHWNYWHIFGHHKIS